MLTLTSFDSAFEHAADLSARTGTIPSPNSGEFDELLDVKLQTSNDNLEISDYGVPKSAEQRPADTALSKSSSPNDTLNGFNAVSGLLVRFWKKKELVGNSAKRIRKEDTELSDNSELNDILGRRSQKKNAEQ